MKILNIFNEKTVLLLVTVFFIFIIETTSIVLSYTYSGLLNDPSQYRTIVSRLSLLLMGSIVSMSIFTYNSKQKISTIEYLNSTSPTLMLLGIVSSIVTFLTIPNQIYLPDKLTRITERIINYQFNINNISIHNFLNTVLDCIKFIPKLFLYFIDKWQSQNIELSFTDILSIINLIAFIFSIILFNLILYKFILSFSVKSIVKRSFNNIAYQKEVNRYRNINRASIKAKINTKTWEILEKKLEISYQHLLYLISLNHTSLVNQYLKNWQEVTSTIYLLLFHAELESDKKSVNYRENLYTKMLSLTSDLILKTADDITYKDQNLHLINSLIDALPIQEQYFIESNEAYEYMFDILKDKYFKQLYKIFAHLELSTKVNIYTQVINKKIHFIEKIHSIHKQSLEYGRKDSISSYVEDFFLSTIYESVNSKSDNLTTVLGLLFTTRNKYIISTNNVSNREIASDVKDLFQSLSLNKIEPTIKKQSRIDYLTGLKEKVYGILHSIDSKVNYKSNKLNNVSENPDIDNKLSNSLLENLIIIIAKACEIQNYSAAGYLVKRISNHLELDNLIPAYKNVQEEILKDHSKELSLSILSLNPYSIEYCLEKSIFLLILQYAYNNKYEIDKNNELSMLNNIIINLNTKNKITFMDSLRDRTKEYNLPCINTESLINIDKFSNSIKQIITFNEIILFSLRNKNF